MREMATDSPSDSSKSLLSAPYTTPLWVWAAVLGVVVLDQLTKFLILRNIPYGAFKPVLPFLTLTLTFNPGAAFSSLASSGGWQRYLFAGVAVVVSVWLIQELRKPCSLLQRWGTLLILGGAVGNLYDRIIHGHVVDFILVHWKSWSFSVFNIADAAITVGVCALIPAVIKETKGT